jgi:hypothetical protein
MRKIDKTDSSLVITTYNCDRSCEGEIKQTLSFILEPLGCEELIMPIYTCINELLTNAIKANFKGVYFERYNPASNADKPCRHRKAPQLFKI